MGTFNIWEVSSMGMSRQPVAQLSSVTTIQNVAISSTHAETAAFDNSTIGVRVVSDTDCWVLLGKTPVATAANGIKVLANQPEYFGVPLGASGGSGWKLSIITA